MPRRAGPILLLWLTLACDARSTDEVTAWRVRADNAAELNQNGGWAAAENEEATVEADRPFRIRFEIDRSEAGPALLRLEARRNGGGWMPLEALDHPYPDEIASSVTSIVSTEAWHHGEETEDLIAASPAPFAGGSGISLRPSPLVASRDAGSSEWEWPIVIRYFSDGATRVDEGDVFEYRVVGWDGTPLAGDAARVTVDVPDWHLGGTYVETPGRIGPFEASNGDLYFLQEPAETYNVFMMLKSGDRGRSWAEQDGTGRPPNGDLEAVSAVLVDGVIHMLHLSDATWYYQFNTSDHTPAPDSWAVNEEEVAPERDPPTQVTALAARSDGSLVAVYGGDVKLHYRIRSTQGVWGGEATVDASTPDTLSGPAVVAGADDEVHLAYVDLQGRGWLRSIRPDGFLTTRALFATGLGTDETERVAILPLNRLTSGEISMVYRLADGRLMERRRSPSGALGAPVVVTSVAVASGPVDSDQVTADAIAVGDDVHVLFVDAETRSLWHVARPAGDQWGAPTLVMDGIDGQWVRGTLLERGPDGPVYGFVVDTGSNGGSGMNRYGEVPIG